MIGGKTLARRMVVRVIEKHFVRNQSELMLPAKIV